MYRTQTFRFLLAALGALALGGRADSQAPGPRPDPQVHQAINAGEGQAPEAGKEPRSPAGASRPLTPQEEAGLINKHRLAVEAAEQLQGLREAGNPHIPEGLELHNLQDDPKETQVDLEKLREAAIRRIENREGFLSPLSDEGDLEAKSDGKSPNNDRVTLTRKLEEPMSAQRTPYPWNHLVLLAAGVLSVISLWVAFRR